MRETYVLKHVSPKAAREFDIAISNVSCNTGKKKLVGNGSNPTTLRETSTCICDKKQKTEL